MNLRAAAWTVALLVAASACGRSDGTAPPSARPASAAPAPTPTPTSPPINVRGRGSGSEPIKLTEFKPGQRRILYVLLTDALRGRYTGADTGTSSMVNPRITFYQPGGKRLYASAPAGTVVEKDKTIRMTGGVHAHSEDGMTLRSDTLRYDDQSEVAHGDGHVVVTSPGGERLEGNTIDWNLRTGDIEMSSTK